MEKILEIKNLSYTYHSLDGETQALKNISFGMEEGEFLSVVGCLRDAVNPLYFQLFADCLHLTFPLFHFMADH